ncbi:MAG: PglZ domain-containing protein [Bacteroidales bacterium]|jgi:DNA-binding response OmpR family regulator|nr:PglZ domain-containing protein [Bacteroidales bacterium]
MNNMTKILWIDDEIELLKPYILFLETKNYQVIPAIDGNEAMEILGKTIVDIIFLDENMPGMNGIDVLMLIKEKFASIPVIMITKSEEEQIMEQAIGSKISDYLIKPVNPNQILLALKKHLHSKQLVSDVSSMNYQQQFREINMRLNERLNASDWIDIYKKLVYWEIELSESSDQSIFEILKQQKDEANNLFCRFYEKNYEEWLNGTAKERPALSHLALNEKLFPVLKADDKPVFLIVIDNFRFDQWKALQPLIEEHLRTESEDIYYSILPTTTQYARNALFAGLMPSEIKKKYSHLWLDEDEEGNKNDSEHTFLQENLKRHGLNNIKTSYHKVLNVNYGMRMIDNLPNFLQNKLNIIVYNFIDMLSHARTESDIVRELAVDEKAYRSVTQTWLEHSPLIEVLKFLSDKDCHIFITTDHGSVKVDRPVKIKSTKDASNNLRYKVSRLLEYNAKEVYEVKDCSKIYLPKLSITSPFIFARSNDFFAYPNNYNYYVSYYMNTFQHGGLSMEENLVPFIHLMSK